ncbi:MAG: hypothetical protein Kow00107_05150 [Planctomycetota bacterium]
MAIVQQCECGAKYNVEKFQEGARFRCKSCGRILTVAKPAEAVAEVPTPIEERPDSRLPTRRPTPPPEVPMALEEELLDTEDSPARPTRRPTSVDDRRTRDPFDRDSQRPTRRPPSGRSRAPEVKDPLSLEDDRPEEPPRHRRPTPADDERTRTRERAVSPRRPTPPPEPVEDEPEVEILEIPEEVMVGKEDFSAKKREVLSKAPGLFGIALIINVVAFIACVGSGIFVIKGMAKPPKSDKAEAAISQYKADADSITSMLAKHLEAAKALGTVDADSVTRGVKGKFASASQQVLKATVTVISDIDVFQRGRPHRIEYYGSGFIFKPDGSRSIEGYIITCYENIAGARTVKVMLSDQVVYDARVIGFDVPANIAVLQLSQDQMKKRNPKLVALDWADSDVVKENVAQYIIAAGAPLGRVNSVSLGIVSCPDRYVIYSIRTGESCGFYNQLFQTDAEINWGSSGGPLVDLDGKVCAVAVTTNGLYDALGLSDYNGLFFAIHGNFARRIANEIKRTGKVTRSYTGILVDSLQALDLESDFKGVAVVGVEPNSPCANAGLAPGDIITKAKFKLNGEEQVITFNARHQPDIAIIYDQLASLPINTEVEFEVRDIYNTKKSPVKVTTAPLPKGASDVVNAEKWGLVVSPLSSRDAAAYGLPDGVGVKVLAVMQGSPAERAGIRAGYAIVSIEQKPITDVRSFRDRYENLNAARTRVFSIEVRRNVGVRGTLGNDLLQVIVKY